MGYEVQSKVGILSEDDYIYFGVYAGPTKRLNYNANAGESIVRLLTINDCRWIASSF